MATARQLIAIKGARVASLPPTATVLQAAQLMNDRHIGSVLVIDRNRLVGIFTERDVMRRIVAEERSAADTTLDEVMTRKVAFAAPHTRLDEIRALHRKRVVGMISIGDLNKAEHDGQVETIRYLEQFMSVA